MVGQLLSTAIANFVANAAHSVNAAMLINRDALKRSGPSRRGELLARGVSSSRQMPLDARYSDMAFVARQIKSHREAIALYEDKANGPDAQLSLFAQHILPHLRQHLTMLESLTSENRHARR